MTLYISILKALCISGIGSILKFQRNFLARVVLQYLAHHTQYKLSHRQNFPKKWSDYEENPDLYATYFCWIWCVVMNVFPWNTSYQLLNVGHRSKVMNLSGNIYMYCMQLSVSLSNIYHSSISFLQTISQKHPSIFSY